MTRKARVIADMNFKQWDRVEAAVGRMVISGESQGKTDREVAVSCLDAVFGRLREREDGSEYIQPPSGGYTPELVDGVGSLVPLRRRQLAGGPR